MANVYVVQESMVRDRSTGDFRPAFDLTPAGSYGELKFLLPSGKVSLSSVPMVNTLRQRLSKFCDEDYLLLTGDPVAILAAGAVASQVNRGRMRVLKWDKRLHDYITVTIDLTPNGGSHGNYD